MLKNDNARRHCRGIRLSFYYLPAASFGGLLLARIRPRFHIRASPAVIIGSVPSYWHAVLHRLASQSRTVGRESHCDWFICRGPCSPPTRIADASKPGVTYCLFVIGYVPNDFGDIAHAESAAGSVEMSQPTIPLKKCCQHLEVLISSVIQCHALIRYRKVLKKIAMATASIDIFECGACGSEPGRPSYRHPGDSLEGRVVISSKTILQVEMIEVRLQGQCVIAVQTAVRL